MIVVEALATRRTSRGQGYASAILAKAHEIAEQDNCCLFLDAADTAFYERRGYSVVADVSGVIALATPMIRKKKSNRN
jgi:predicted acetyltransferase